MSHRQPSCGKSIVKQPRHTWLWFSLVCALLSAGVWLYWNTHYRYYGVHSIPLAITGGDPYIRALMRTISASEANSDHPYTLLYGGDQFSDVSRHPDICLTIMTRVNQGNCSTAAGRYQMLTTTWLEKSKRYPSKTLFWQDQRSSAFIPERQDQVVYDWLSDRKAWNMDIAARLRHDDLSSVLRRLSATWTSLGYGIESNTNS